MKFTITGKNFTVDEKLKQRIEKKFAKLDKYFSEEINMNVTMEVDKLRKTLEANALIRGNNFRAEETCTDMFDSIDRVLDKMTAQMSKHKTKKVKKHKDKMGHIIEVDEDEDYDEDEEYEDE